MDNFLKNKLIFRKHKKILSLLILCNTFFYSSLSLETLSKQNQNTDLNNEVLDKDLINNNVYILGPGDVLKIKFYGNKEFNGKFTILNDGSLSLPVIGGIRVEGLSIELAKKRIENLYKNELLIPNIDITLESIRQIRVSVIGEINNPGIYAMTPSTSLNNLKLSTVVDALLNAGGVTQEADLTKIILIRKVPGEKSFKRKTELNLLSAILEGDQSQNLVLFDGDVIELKKAKLMQEGFKIAASNISPKNINVTVIGAVESPGRKKINANSTLTQAVLQAGGAIDWRSNKNNIQLIRLNKNGSATLKKYRLNLREGASTKNPILRDGDIVKVNSSLLNKTIKASSAITEPLREVISIYTLVKILD